MKRPGRFVCSLLVVAAFGATGLSFAQERQMGRGDHGICRSKLPWQERDLSSGRAGSAAARTK